MDSVNFSQICGSESIQPWIQDKVDFGLCFQKLALDIPVTTLLMAFSVYYIGRDGLLVVRNTTQRVFLNFRILLVLLLIALRSSDQFIKIKVFKEIIDPVEYLSALFDVAAWLAQFVYIQTIKNRIKSHISGPWPIVISVFLKLIVTSIFMRTTILRYLSGVSKEYEFFIAISDCGLYILFFLTHFPFGSGSYISIDYEEALLSSGAYNRFRDNPYYLGVACEGITFVSKLLFSWVSPLLSKGRRGLLNTYDDLFDLPMKMNTARISKVFQEVLKRKQNDGYGKRSLMSTLNSCFGFEFYSLGILKLLADVASFLIPFLLSEIIDFIDNKNETMLYGYLLAGGLCLASLVGSCLSVHFNYQAETIAVRIEGTIISTVYRKMLTVSLCQLSDYNVGQIATYISSDVKRIANFALSFHALWSCPIQIAVVLYLLYIQIGWAFLAGLGFAIFAILLNRYIAVQIARLTRKMLAAKDERVKVTSEALSGIQNIKFLAIEEYFLRRIFRLREKELKYLKGRKYLDAICVYFWASTPVLISLFTFTLYSFLGYDLVASKVFTSLALFNMLLFPLNALPWIFNGIIEAYISLKRVQQFVFLPEVETIAYYRTHDDTDSAFILSDVTCQWDAKAENEFQVCLRDVSLTIKRGQFLGVVGPVGSGKSALLYTLLGELDKVRGRLSVGNFDQVFSVATQEVWLQNTTIRENILFGSTYQGARYKAVIEACALKEDLDDLPEGDKTLVSDSGANLSGGQKARVALARAVYQESEVYLFDDILSAVDAHVGRHIVTSCLHGFLSGKTVVLATHQSHWLQNADWVVVMERGKIEMQGTPGEVLPACQTIIQPPSPPLPRVPNDLEESSASMNPEIEEDNLEDEDRAADGVSFNIWMTYFNNAGIKLTLFTILARVFMQASRHTADYWLAHWVSAKSNRTSLLVRSNHLVPNHSLYGSIYNISSNDFSEQDEGFHFVDLDDVTKYYLIVFGIIAGINSALILFRAFLFAFGGIRSARTIHNDLIKSLLSGNISFYDYTPVGRIINRLSSDMALVDDTLPFDLNIFLATSISLIGTTIFNCFGLPWIILALLPLAMIYFQLQSYYRQTYRELRRVGAITMSPLYASFIETFNGLPIIRAFRMTSRFIQGNEIKIDGNLRCVFASYATSSWLAMRVQLLGVGLTSAICLVAVLQHHFHTVDPGIVGLLVTYSLTMNGMLSASVTSFADTERDLVSVERTEAYTKKVVPEKWRGVTSPPVSWPQQGAVTFENVCLQYREHLPFALDNITFEVNAGEKIGIVGRTGSGKTSLFKALFRIVEVTTGDIIIDDLSIRLLPLHDLRFRIAIIPQDPFLFSGTVRENLDPNEEHMDSELWVALNKTHLSSAVHMLGGLSADVGIGGKQFSTGQKQLLCLARAVLRNAKIICVDEATANCDGETDRFIQHALRSVFHNSTVFTVAHRLHTVLDSDRVMVMGNGIIKEFDTPANLLANPESEFAALASEAGISS
ncbi:ATP-binding cassette sub-family C member 10-like isoform X2 [Artemia franciscana]|nr:hypothetical protein QYM36_015324 [Artemia franciscana]KAK2707579.1 hypothetical protein QYM36_015324 [Artemia franciscana]